MTTRELNNRTPKQRNKRKNTLTENGELGKKNSKLETRYCYAMQPHTKTYSTQFSSDPFTIIKINSSQLELQDQHIQQT